MTLGKPIKKWSVNMMTPDYREDERIGTLVQGIDFFMFIPRDATLETIVYPQADDVKSIIKMNYGHDHKFSIGNVEHFF